MPSASLVPSTYDDEGTLFTTAGMQPMIPYLLGKTHPDGKRIADVQKCVRTGDIEDVGDNRHLTFFEMLGNWSLGDYFKKESLEWSFDFLTNKEYGLGLDPKRFYVTVFKGLPASGTDEEGIPRDEESIKIWQEIFSKYGISNGIAGDGEKVTEGVRIIPLGMDDNFWIAGTSGPCGGDSEIFYDTNVDEQELEGKFEELVNSFRLIEVWNNVFMEYNKSPEGKYEPLATKNVDTGMGLERTTSVINGVNVFETDLFAPIMSEIKQQVANYEEKSARIVADHVRTAVFMIADGVTPSNTDRGYVLRRIIRRAVRFADGMQADTEVLSKVAYVVIEKYKKVYPELEQNREKIFDELNKEEEKFRKTLTQGLKKFDMTYRIATSFIENKGDEKRLEAEAKKNRKRLPGLIIFRLITEDGFPLELIEEEAKKRDLDLDIETFNRLMAEHREISKAGSEQKFKGGLAGTGEMETKYHTATHMLLAALRQVLKAEIVQKGSNITAERLRFDFNWPEKLTPEQIKAVEDLVNEKIQENIPVEMLELPKEEAKKIVTTLSFDLSKYGDIVKVYKIGDFSAEFCGGPHVESTGVLGHFKITKEEASSAGVRRIKAVLE